MTVNDYLRAADAAARMRAPGLSMQWIRVSHVVGGMMPHGSIADVMQEAGRLDLLIRAIEDERDPMLHPLVPIAMTWVALSYEAVRALHQRSPALPGLEPLLRRLELVRMPLFKSEVARERPNRMPPIDLYAYPPTSAEEAPRRYDRLDDQRAYRPVAAMTEQGLAWGVVDAVTCRMVWVTRRSLADALLAVGAACDPGTAD